MIRRFSVNFAVFSIGVDAGLTACALYLAVLLRPLLAQLPVSFYIPSIYAPTPEAYYVITPILWTIIFLLTSVYDPKRAYKVVDEFQNVSVSIGLAALVFAGLLFFSFREFSRWLFASFILIDLILLLGWRIIARLTFKWRRTPASERRVLIIGAGQIGQNVGKMIRQYYWTGLNLVGFLDDDPHKRQTELPILGTLDDVRQTVKQKQIDDVIIALPQRAYGKINRLALTLHDLPVHVRVVPDYFSLALYRATVDDFGGVPLINLRDPALNDVQRLMKRIFDLFIGSIMILLISPFLLIIAILVKLDSPGSIILKQNRIGENGRIFSMYKFRSMVDGAEKLQKQINRVDENGHVIHKHADDPRITRIGRILRRTSLDELPQLFNVLKGDMSLVGPRPELPWLVTQYQPWQHKRLAVPQGMTGWWQVNSRSERTLHLHTEDDIYYIQNYSLWLDLYILLKTPWVVLRGKGAY
jgi:exopolysaccharide biosynthesis polyprenyl glycosylphosphotransferase